MPSIDELNKKNLELANSLLALSQAEKDPVKKQQFLDAAEQIKQSELDDHFSLQARQKNYNSIAGNFEQWDKEAKEIIKKQISDPAIRTAALNNRKYKEDVLAMALEDPFQQPMTSKIDYIARLEAIKAKNAYKLKKAKIIIFIVFTLTLTGLLWLKL